MLTLLEEIRESAGGSVISVPIFGTPLGAESHSVKDVDVDSVDIKTFDIICHLCQQC